MRTFRLAFSLFLLLGGCSETVVHRCTNQADCHADATCSEGFCIFDPLPRLRVVASSDRARVGEVVKLDTSGSLLPKGSSIELFLKPPDAAEILPPETEDELQIRVVRPHVSLEATLLARSPTGRPASKTIAIAPQNSAPEVRLELPASLQPGELVDWVAEIVDPDGDPFEIEWSYEGPGEFSAEGASAQLLLPQDDFDSEHRIRVRADDGFDVGEASASFRAENLPPVIETIAVPPAVEHQCDEQVCRAFAKLEAVVRDVGPLSYDWFLRDDTFDGEVNFEGGFGPSPQLILVTPLLSPIARTYPIEVVVRDPHGALSSATAEVSVSNRPPLLRAHDETPLHHEYLSEGRFRWYRNPGTVTLWEDPDGDAPAPNSILWSSPEPDLLIVDPKTIDPRIEIEGGPELLGRRILVSVVAQDVNGAKASSEAVLELGNRPPVLDRYAFFAAAEKTMPKGRFFQRIDIDVSDPDGDPFQRQFFFDPNDLPDPSYDMTVEEYSQRRFVVEGNAQALGKTFSYVFRAEDVLGGVVTVHLEIPFRSEP